MAKKIRIDNPDLTYEEQSYLSADYSSGVNLSVRNNQGFTANYFVLVGEPTQEQSEIKQISSTSGTGTIVLASALSFSHPKSTPIYESQWDKISVERKVSGGAFAAITDSPFNIDWDDDDNTTLIADASGSDSHIYRWRFYNSITGTYSSYSGELSATGLTRDQAGFVIQKVRRNRLLTEGIEDEVMYEYMTDFNDLVYEKMPDAWWFEKEGIEVATVASTYRYSIEENWPDLLSINHLLFHYVNGSTDETYPIDYMPLVEFYNMKRDADQATDDQITSWTLLPVDDDSDKGYIGLHATPKTDDCFIKPVYNFELDDITLFSDTLIVPKPKAYEDYVLYRIAEDIRNDSDNANKYQARNEANLALLKKRSKRQLGQKEFMKYQGQKGYKRLFNGLSHYYRPNRVDYW